jgi:hypothetical protein
MTSKIISNLNQNNPADILKLALNEDCQLSGEQNAETLNSHLVKLDPNKKGNNMANNLIL